MNNNRNKTTSGGFRGKKPRSPHAREKRDINGKRGPELQVNDISFWGLKLGVGGVIQRSRPLLGLGNPIRKIGNNSALPKILGPQEKEKNIEKKKK